MQLIVEDSSAVIIDANKTLFINDTANANMTTGITINQGNNQNEILTFKSSDVAAGTVVSEPDTYAYLSKITSTGGGLNQVAISDAQISTNPTLRLQGWAGSNASTSKTTSAVGIVTAFATQHDGAGSQSDIVANGNAFVVQGRSGGANNGLFIVDEDGDLFADGGTSSTNMVTKFDDFHDAALVEDFNEYLGAGEKPDFERLRRMARLDLVGAVTEEEWNTGVRPLWNVTRTVQLHNGAHAQAWVREQVRDTILAQLIPGYRQAMEMLATGRNIGSLPEMIAA